MGLFSKILDKLGLGKKDKQTSAAKPPAQAPTATGARARPGVVGRRGPVHTVPPAKPVVAPVSEMDVVKKLEGLAQGSGLNWKASIVDLLKLLDIDSSREARNELAKELGCPPELMKDSAKMNVWLHKEVLRKIAQNGGNIPQELLD